MTIGGEAAAKLWVEPPEDDEKPSES